MKTIRIHPRRIELDVGQYHVPRSFHDKVSPLGRVRVHPSWIEHDAICRAVTGRVPCRGFIIETCENLPVGNIVFVHEVKTLARVKDCQCADPYEEMMCGSHVTDLCEECHKFAKCLEPRLIKWAQEGHHHQCLVMGIGWSNDFQQRDTMVPGIVPESWGRD